MSAKLNPLLCSPPPPCVQFPRGFSRLAVSDDFKKQFSDQFKNTHNPNCGSPVSSTELWYYCSDNTPSAWFSCKRCVVIMMHDLFSSMLVFCSQTATQRENLESDLTRWSVLTLDFVVMLTLLHLIKKQNNHQMLPSHLETVCSVCIVLCCCLLVGYLIKDKTLMTSLLSVALKKQQQPSN